MYPTTLVATAALAALVLGGCADADEAAPAAADPTQGPAEPAAATPTEVTVTATDYGYDAPAEVEAGLVTFEMVNAGSEVHHAQLLRINPGGSVDDALAALERADFEALFAEATVAGGVGVVAPGASAAATVNLPPGEYALFCGVPSEHDGVPHFAKGMISTFTVTGEAPAPPAVDTVGEVVLSEFAFELPDELDGPVAVTNAGAQPHEMLIVQLGEGVTLEEALASLDGPPPTDGPPPAVPVGGMQALMPGETGYVDFGALGSGTYGLVCFIPDPESGQPHLALGMVSELEIER